MGTIFTDDAGKKAYQSGFGGEEIDERLAKAHTALQAKDIKNITNIFDYDNPAMHTSFYRGKNLGSSFTDAQKATIANGKFDDLYVGDYWVIGSVVYRIVDIDYWYRQGEKSCTNHHLVIMPDTTLYTHAMNDSDSTDTGYLGSKMHTEGLEQAKETIGAAFGSSFILSYNEYLTNATTSGHPSAGAWTDVTIELPNEPMMFGSFINTPASDGTFISLRYTISRTQLAGMRLMPRLINPERQNQWLRNITSATNFAYISSSGHASNTRASTTSGVRPVFGIHG